ncbi:hypothetical protein BTJ39_12270 [Izhakiella australiensis]|uniref:Uncharacterized protein n=1 Tax=Izhakiella australiensis TaxID=1926881 RepID=A0A1S8YLI8_9GAMM|nr:hypothetical protein BTJ39_12270 [Izhakiella australiensis]
MVQVCGKRHPFLIDNGVGRRFAENGIRFLLKSKTRLRASSPAQTCFYLFTQSDEEVYGGGEGPAAFSRLAARDGRAPGHTDVLAPVRKAAGPFAAAAGWSHVVNLYTYNLFV